MEEKKPSIVTRTAQSPGGATYLSGKFSGLEKFLEITKEGQNIYED